MGLNTKAQLIGDNRKRPSKLTHEILRSRAPSSRITAVMFFVLVALVLTIINRRVIAQAHFELGDFAANSLLIQDAKSLSLFKGNYSRMGFNHPGPAILYVLALGEVFFHDWTRIAPSAFGGQLIAITIYSACWITLIGVMFHKLSKSLFATGLSLTVFLTISAFSQYEVFAGAWFPHLYYFPFALFTVALARLVCGRGDALIPLAISWGFLANGHVAFIAITTIMLAGALVANQVLSKVIQKEACLSWLSWEVLFANGRTLLGSLAIVLFFLAPLVVETLIHFPGPVYNYISYGAGHHTNAIVESLQFAGSYWASRPLSVPVIWGILLFGLLYTCSKGEEYFADILGLLTALLLATIGVVLYAKAGIDDLSQKYLGLFYYSAPAIAAATATYCLYRKIDVSGKRIVACVAIGLGLGAMYIKVRQPPEYVGFYNQPEIPVMFEKMRGLGSLPLVLDLDSSNDWGYVWSTVVGIETYAKRLGVQLFCVNRNWHVLFTDAMLCTENAVQIGSRFIVSRSRPTPTNLADLTPALDYLGLSFYRHFDHPFISTKESWTVGSNKFIYSNYLLGKGWSGIEENFVWSIGKDSELFLRIDSQQVNRIHLDVAAFLPKPDSVQQVAVKINDVIVAHLTFSADANRGFRTVDLPQKTNEFVKINLSVSNPTSPQQAGLSGDPRVLGIALYGISTD